MFRRNNELAIFKGMAWLDMARPDWIKEIDLKKLDMMNDCQCILGQLYGNSEAGGRYLFGPNFDAPMVAHGLFAAGNAEVNTPERKMEWRNLTADWKKFIRKRLRAMAQTK